MTERDNWFSNFGAFENPMVYDGITYTTPEHFYQAMKVSRDAPDFMEQRQEIAALPTPRDAKIRSRSIKIRSDWNEVRVRVMRIALEHKFSPGTSWHKELIATGSEFLCEYNYWHDNFWGRCTCQKCEHVTPKVNMLGELLMEIRGRKV